jgi:outer membrane protein TolC
MIKSQNTIQNTLDDSRLSYMGLLPEATYSASYRNPARVTDYFSSSFSIGKSIYLNDPTYFNIKRSNLAKKMVELHHENLQKKTALDIIFSYIDIMQHQKNISIMEENARLQRRIYDQINIQFEARRKTIYELQQAQIDTLNTHIQLIELHEILSRKRSDLFFMINMNDEGFPLEIYDFAITDDIDVSLKSLNLRSSELALEQSRHSLNQQHLSLYPTLYANYSWGTSYQNIRLNDEFIKPNNYSESGTFSINVSYPLFNHVTQSARYRIARRNFHQERYELDELALQIDRETQNLLADIDRLKINYGLYQQKLDLSRVNLQIAEERFVMGIISTLDLDRARVQYLESEFQLSNQFYTLIKKQEELNFITSSLILGRW